ncbi:OFA family MFS transporter [Aminipila butyrica]|uniref:OFA family MFS transporter n=1 Tax=Aminipila butyrica TaxID=433296 RepID=A0A858BY62_9FIRM|nr:OFA family MFS transporter [Aminipila butyrica]QIB70065.1 OFA family MFS transporter [Aminipila butyrica]
MEQDKKRYGILAMAWIITFFVSAVSAFSVLSAGMTDSTTGILDTLGNPKFTSSQLANAYAIYQLCLAIVGIFAGRIVDKMGPRTVVFIGSLVFSLGWFITGFCDEIVEIYLAFGILAGSGAGMVYNPNVTAALRWFPDKRGLISGLLLASAALGPFTFSPVASTMIHTFGSSQTAFKIFGVVCVIFMAASALFLRKADDGYLPAGYTVPKIQANGMGPSIDFIWKEMLKSPLFYTLLFIFISATTAGNMFVGANYSIAQIQIGADASEAAMAVSICALANFGGRILFGYMTDKVGAVKSLIISLCITGITLVLMMFVRDLPFYIMAVSLIGIGFGAVMVIFPPLCGQIFGVKNLSTNYGFVFLGYAGSAFVGPRIAAYFKDYVGNFQGAYLIALGITFLGLLLVFLFCTLRKKKLAY